MTAKRAERIAERIVNRLYEVDASRRRILLAPVPEEESRAFIRAVLLEEPEATPDRTIPETVALPIQATFVDTARLLADFRWLAEQTRFVSQDRLTTEDLRAHVAPWLARRRSRADDR